ncbi:AAA family ATPase [Methylobacter sp.]|uniref:AAA family ATPase n=1 Tax=Methylobacter sp. TaxID=2051955 RepID=UPI002FDCD297
MYSHAKNNKLRHYLKHKAAVNEPEKEIDSSQMPDVIEVFDIDKMHAVLNIHEKRSNLYRNHQRYIDYLGETDGFLTLAILPNDIPEQLEQLRMSFPNFSDAIDFYRQQFALAQLSDQVIFSANPLLLTGPPGVGKTAFCHELAKLVSTHFELISLSGITAGFVLGGMSSGWSEGKPGRIVEALARGHNANPLIVVDEIDKSGGDQRYDPLGPLYQLLEKETSAAFVDEALEIAADCSHIVWAGTANRAESIPEPILSRFTVIEVKRPTQKEMEKVLRSIYQKIRQNYPWGEQFNEDLSSTVVSKIIECELEPRLVQKELIAACGNAVLRNSAGKSSGNGRYDMSPEDFNPRDSVKPRGRIVMPIFSVAPIYEEPKETIVRWSIREALFKDSHDKSRHLIGYIARKCAGRVTSAIQSFDRETMRIKTTSGRIYQLEGQPGFDPDAEYVWAQWKALNEVRDEVDVTHEYRLMH